MCATFSRDQYISLHYLNANLRYVVRNTDRGNFLTLLSTPAKAPPRVTKKQEGIGENSNYQVYMVNVLKKSIEPFLKIFEKAFTLENCSKFIMEVMLRKSVVL